MKLLKVLAIEDSAIMTELWALFWQCLVTTIYQGSSETTLNGATFTKVCLISRSSEIV